MSDVAEINGVGRCGAHVVTIGEADGAFFCDEIFDDPDDSDRLGEHPTLAGCVYDAIGTIFMDRKEDPELGIAVISALISALQGGNPVTGTPY